MEHMGKIDNAEDNLEKARGDAADEMKSIAAENQELKTQLDKLDKQIEV